MKLTIKELKELIRETVLPEPFRTEEEWAICDAMTNDPSLAGALPVENLLLDTLIPTQDMSQTGTNPMTSRPIIVFDNGLGKYVIDGHHRLKRAQQQGETSIDAYVLRSTEPMTVKSAAKLMQMSVNDLLDGMSSSDRAKFRPV